MITFFIYLTLILLCGFNFSIITNPLKELKNSSLSNTYKLYSSNALLFYIFYVTLHTGIGYFLTLFLKSFFEFDNNIFILIGITIILVSYLWPYSNKFKPKYNVILLLTGICSTFFIHFIWIIPLLFCIATFIFNSKLLGFLITPLTTLVFYGLNETIAEYFVFIILITTIILVFQYVTDILNLFEGKKQTLQYEFENR